MGVGLRGFRGAGGKALESGAASFHIDPKTRRVTTAGAAPQSDGQWMQQVALGVP
jgi:ABC-type tungstate transport system substrate-binding protein